MNLRGKIFKKIVSCVLSAAMVLSSFAIATPVSAGDTWPMEGDAVINANHPRTLGQRVYDIENWEPDSEPYADLMKASVPLQQRNDAFRATQANPNLTSEAEIYNMGGDYGNSFFEATPYNNEFSEFAFNFWQYIDYYASWHGVTTKGAPIDEYEPDGPWQQRYFEFGLINIPNPAYTNAAHKNGVKSIGCIFLPRAGQTHASLLKKDENGEFPVAKKLVEFTKYYGFDGYFINQEESIPQSDVEPYKELTKYLNSQGVWTQWYDSLSPTGNLGYQNKLNASNATWIHDAEYGLGKVNSSLFVNYDWFRGDNLKTSFEYAEANGINLFTETYFGVEANQAKFSGSHGSSQVEMLYEPGTNNLRGSLALFTPTDFIQNQLDENLYGGSNANNVRARDDYQWMIMERERMYYSGVAQNPTDTGRMKGYENPRIGINDASGWCGVADFASERSVVADNTFYTNFNTGHGLEYRENGVITNDEEWSNLNIQNILPTWQWWIDTPKRTSRAAAKAEAVEDGIPQVIGGNGTVDTAMEAPAYAAAAAEPRAAHSVTVAEGIVGGTFTVNNANPNAGSYVTITPKPEAGYRVVVDSVKFNDTETTYNEYSKTFYFQMPDEDVVITGEFEKIPVNPITIENTPNGTLTVNAENPDEVMEGTAVVITVTPDEGYQMVRNSLKVNGEVLKDTTSFVMPAEAVTITAEFELLPYEKLHADFDYGEEYFTGAADFTPIGAYKGGSSLVLSGKLEAHNFLHLYKTDLQVKDSSTMSLTYYKPSKSDGTEMQLALIFKSNPDEVKYIPIAGSGTKTNGWKTAEIDLSAYAGEDIAVIGLGFNPKQGEVENYQMNIGEIKFTDGADYTPAAPENFRITKSFSTGDMIVKWDMADYDEVHQYNIYANLSDGTRRFVGGLYGDTFYIKSLYGEDKNVTLELCAVGKDGTESVAATASYDFENAASGVKVEEEYTANHNKLQSANAGFLNVSWTNPAADYESMELTVIPAKYHDYKVREEVYTKTVPAGVSSTQIKTPIADGSEYDLALTPVYADGTKGETIHYTGYFKDTYIEPFDEGYEIINGNSITFNIPKSEDWWHMYVYANGTPLTFRSEYDSAKQFAIRGKSFIHNVPLPSNFMNGVIEVVLEDYSGNRSEPFKIYHYKDETAQVTEAMFPDAALLAAVREQAGETVKEALEFDGTLDLSGLNIQNYAGLNLLTNLKTLDLSGNDFTAITEGMIDTKAEKIILKDCKELTMIARDALSGLENLKELDITGCTALELLYLNNTNLEMLTYGDAEDFENLVTADLSGSRFDMSEGTPEREFADAIAEMTADKDDIVAASPEESNLVLNPTIISSTLNDATAKALFDGNTMRTVVVSGTWPVEVVIDIGMAQTIERYEATLFANEGWAPQGMKIYGSNDAENFELIVSRDAYEKVWTGDVSDPKAYRYYKVNLEHPNGGSKYLFEIQMFGHFTEKHTAGVAYGNQRPNAYVAEIPAEVTLDRQDLTVNLENLLVNSTVRGTSFADLAGADFLDPDYDLGNPAHVAYIENGETTFNDLDLSKDGTYNVTFTSFETIDLNGKVLGETVITVGNGGAKPADKSALEALVDTAEDVDTDKYTDETVKALEDALARAKDILAKEDATQEEVDAAYDALETALNGLAEKDPTGGSTDTPDTGDYGMGLTMVLLLAAMGTALFVFRRRLAK